MNAGNHELSEMRSVIRQLVAEVVEEVLPPKEDTVVVLENSEDLNRFVRDLVARTSRDSVYRQRLLSGRVAFNLHPSSQLGTKIPQPTPGSTLREPMVLEKGVLTERMVQQAIQDNRTIRCSARVVKTPLAKELIRTKQVEVEEIA